MIAKYLDFDTIDKACQKVAYKPSLCANSLRKDEGKLYKNIFIKDFGGDLPKYKSWRNYYIEIDRTLKYKNLDQQLLYASDEGLINLVKKRE